MFETELVDNNDDFVMFDKPINVRIVDAPVDVTLDVCCTVLDISTVQYCEGSLEFDPLPGIKLAYKRKKSAFLLKKVMFEYMSNRPIDDH